MHTRFALQRATAQRGCLRRRALACAAGLGVLGLLWLASCGGKDAAAMHAGAPGGALESATPAGAGPTIDGLSAGLLAQFSAQPGPGGPPRQLSAVDFVLPGVQFSGWSGAPSVSPSPADPSAVRLVTDATQQTAYAIFAIAPQTAELASLPKRLHFGITAAPAAPGAAPLPLQYYYAVSNYTNSEWSWHGPLTADYEPLLNSSGQRDRYFDLNGQTLVVVAIAPGPDGRARAVDLGSVGYSVGEQFYPVKPYRLRLTADNLGSALSAPDPDNTFPVQAINTVNLPAASAPNPSVFQYYGFTQAQVWRRDAGMTTPLAKGSIAVPGAGPGALQFRDPLDTTQNFADPVPGQTAAYSVRLSNAQGAAAVSTEASLTTLLAAPEWLDVTAAPAAIELRWQVQTGLTNYELYRDGALLKTLAGNVGDYADMTALPGVEHTYVVRAVCGLAMTDSAPVTRTAEYGAPVWRIAEPTPAGVHLEWHMYAPPQGFELYRDGALLTSLPSGQSTFDDPDVAPGQTYAYVMRGLLDAGQSVDSAPAAVLTWPWPAYDLAPDDGGPTGRGELLDLAGHPALLAPIINSTNYGFFTIYEAQDGTVADSPAAWTATMHGAPTIEPLGMRPQGLTDGEYYATCCSCTGEPACAIHSELSSYTQFDASVQYRQSPTGPSPPPPDELPWINTYAPSVSLVDSLALASVGSRLAMTWRDETTLKIYYAHALVDQPGPSTDWDVQPAVAPGGANCHVAELDGLPALVVGSAENIALYRAASLSPGGPADWQHSDVITGLAQGGAAPLLGSVGGKPFITYYDTALHTVRFARALTPNPAASSDWVVGSLTPELTSPGPARFIDYAGKPAAVFTGQDGRAWLAVATGATPSGPADWTRTALDLNAGSTTPGLVESGGQLYVSFWVTGQLRTAGWYIMLPPAGL